MNTVPAPGVRSSSRLRSKKVDALTFVDLGRTDSAMVDVRARLEDFNRRYPQRALKAGQRGIVQSQKSDRDRR